MTYQSSGSPFGAHLRMPVRPAHFSLNAAAKNHAGVTVNAIKLVFDAPHYVYVKEVVQIMETIDEPFLKMPVLL